LILIDGKRVAQSALNGGIDIQLIPFSMIDHIDILKDGASAVYGADAVAGVVNFFLIHKFRGLEIGGTYGNTNLGASNDMGEWEAWLKAGTGDDKTDIVVIADFYQRTGGTVQPRPRPLLATRISTSLEDSTFAAAISAGRVTPFRLIPEIVFQRQIAAASFGGQTLILLRFMSGLAGSVLTAVARHSLEARIRLR
jgi:outer membrane receptor protein involved in Fe transport